MDTTYPILGVRVPVLRTLTRHFAKENPEFWKTIPLDSREAILIYGFGLSKCNYEFKEFCNWLEVLFPVFDNWEATDIISSSLKPWKNWLKEGYSYLETLLSNENPFVVRFAIVMYLNYYMKTEYFEDCLKIIAPLKSEHYYVKMAIAWFMSMAYVKNPKKTSIYLKKLDAWTYQKTIQKCRESRQIPLPNRKMGQF